MIESDPALGRFFATDPLASATPSYSPYHVNANNPIMYTDPLGLSPQDSRFKDFGENRDQEKGDYNDWDFGLGGGMSSPFGINDPNQWISYFDNFHASFDNYYESKEEEEKKKKGKKHERVEIKIDANTTLVNEGGYWELKINESEFSNYGNMQGVTTVYSGEIDDNSDAVASGLAAGWVIGFAEPTPIGEGVMIAVTAATAIVYGPQIVDKIKLKLEGDISNPFPGPWTTSRPEQSMPINSDDFNSMSPLPNNSGGGNNFWGPAGAGFLMIGIDQYLSEKNKRIKLQNEMKKHQQDATQYVRPTPIFPKKIK